MFAFTHIIANSRLFKGILTIKLLQSFVHADFNGQP